MIIYTNFLTHFNETSWLCKYYLKVTGTLWRFRRKIFFVPTQQLYDFTESQTNDSFQRNTPSYRQRNLTNSQSWCVVVCVCVLNFFIKKSVFPYIWHGWWYNFQSWNHRKTFFSRDWFLARQLPYGKFMYSSLIFFLKNFLVFWKEYLL